MYGFPKIEILSELINCRLVMIACTLNQIYLHFDNNISITCEKDFSILYENGSVKQIGIPLSSSFLFSLLEVRVKSVELFGTMSLNITMANATIIRLEDDLQYESFKFNLGEKEIIV